MSTAVERVTLPYQPRPHQRRAHRDRKRFSVLVWHRRSGKTVFSIMELVLGALNSTRERARFGYVAPLYRQAREIAWDYLKHYARAIPNTEIRESDLAVTFGNGATVRLYGADNPDSLRGLYFDGVVLDEFADMKPNVLDEIIRPALADRLGWLLIIGTPKGVNAFSDAYHRALRDDTWYASLLRASDTDAVDPVELESARQSMAPSRYAQEFECDFAAAVENALIPLDLARTAATRVYGQASYSFAPVVLGVDVARYGDDRSVIFPRQGLVAFEPSVFQGVDTMALADHVIAAARKYHADAVFVDEGAMGAGVIDRLRQLRQTCTPINFGSSPTLEIYQNKRAEMWSEMGKWLQDGGRIPNSEPLIADLCALTYTHNSAGRLVLESKETAKARGVPSPDLADALALTFAAPVNKAPAFAAPSGPQRYVPPSQRR